MKTSKFAILVILIFLSFLAGSLKTEAGSAMLKWNSNTEDDLDGYKIYYGTSSHAGTCPSGYDNSVVVTDNANTGYWFDNLTPGQNYYFQLTAIDDSGNESGCSVSPGEVSKLITYRGDINTNPDHSVNMNDFTLLASDYGKSSFCGTATTNKADINRDCVVNINDFTLLADNYGQSF
ncbi:MAG: hypothetical protein UR60_C0009G0007 [Candidatus Moranbacteria bacterium GW2011_GWF2_34_56]|nr:MAG: hypothetical protein UR51_C0006G0084 [Candidatus Moranbacteria bacterium GW2011_GWF1_34_10]KKP65048.1 MAG: hypothetical protein UR60_C0009G0007 [Candidatus Moranbacteria bacterium GW2011_GWF2_34_56]HBI16635.1 hypothetical protein [Candidatus Moranbacteria bacterium]